MRVWHVHAYSAAVGPASICNPNLLAVVLSLYKRESTN